VTANASNAENPVATAYCVRDAVSAQNAEIAIVKIAMIRQTPTASAKNVRNAMNVISAAIANAKTAKTPNVPANSATAAMNAYFAKSAFAATMRRNPAVREQSVRNVKNAKNVVTVNAATSSDVMARSVRIAVNAIHAEIHAIVMYRVAVETNAVTAENA